MEDIKLFSPNDKPFGKLSNNAYHPITIDGKNYPTVTNYILSNMLIIPLSKTILQNTPIHGSRGVNNEMMRAIDFFLENPKKQTMSVEKPDNYTKKLLILHNLTKISVETLKKWGENTLSLSIRYIGKLNKNFNEEKATKYLQGAIKKYKKTKKIGDFIKSLKNKIPETLSPTKEELEESLRLLWEDFSSTGELKKYADESKQRQNYMNYIMSQVRKPFESVDLIKLKERILREAQVKQMGIYKVYNKAVKTELFNIISSAVDEGYNTLFKKPELSNVLLGTGNFPIQYESHDPFLGIGKDGNGSNLVGKILMQIRHNLRIKSNEDSHLKNEQDKYTQIYNTYLAYSVLRAEIYTNNNQLTEYLGLNPTQIIEKYGKSNLVKGVASQDTIIKLYKHEKLNPIIMTELFQPGTLVINIRKKELRSLRNRMLLEKDDFIFNSYIEYIIKRNHNDNINTEVERLLDIQDKLSETLKSREEILSDIVEDSIAKEKAKLSTIQLSELKSRVLDLFRLGMLSASLSDKIDAGIEILNIPSEEDVKEAEISEIVPAPNKKIDEGDDEGGSSVISSGSSENDPDVKQLKKIFKYDKNTTKRELIDQIIKLKGCGRVSEFNDWSTTELRQRIEALQEFETKQENIETSIKGGLFIQPNGNPIGIFKEENKNYPELRPFCPEFYTGMLNIKGHNYPTIQHYIIAKLISTTGTKRTIDPYGDISFEKGIGINEAHKLIMINPNNTGTQTQDYLKIELIGKLYDNINRETNEKLLSIYTVSGLNKKFEDRTLQNLLLSTDNANIDWMGPDLYLGIGQPNTPGFNYVGKTMMVIRNKIKIERSKEEKIVISEKDLLRFINKDQIILDFIRMRILDMCDIVYKTQQYMKIKENLNYDMGEETDFIRLINTVLDVIYQPCSTLVEMSKDVEVTVPSFIIRIVKNCKGMSTGEPPLYVTNQKGVTTYNKEIQDYISRIERRKNKLDTEFYGMSNIKHSKAEVQEFQKNQLDEWHKFWEQLVQSTLSKEDKNTELENFKQKQKQEYNEFWDIKKTKKSKEDFNRLEHNKSELNKEKSRYLQNARDRQNHYDAVTKNIAQIYWNRIVVMISTLIKNVKPSTESNIRDILIKLELLNSEKTNCVRIIENEENNCIVSALFNILKGVQQFKGELTPKPTELDEDDVKFSTAILLNSAFKPLNVSVEEDNTQNEEKIFNVNESGLFPDDNPDDNPIENEEGAKTKGKNTEIDKIEQHILLFSQENSRKVSEEIFKMLQVIKKSNLNNKIKQNRINFFATIR